MILLQEALEMKNQDIGRIQAILALQLISNLGKAEDDYTDAYFQYGCIQLFFK